MLSGCCGCLFVCSGASNICNLISDVNGWIRSERTIENDTQCKRITRIIANVLLLIGTFALAWAAFSIGATLFTVGATAGFLIALQQGLLGALPQLIIGVSGIALGAIGNRLGGGPAFPDPLWRAQSQLTS